MADLHKCLMPNGSKRCEARVDHFVLNALAKCGYRLCIRVGDQLPSSSEKAIHLSA
jgi:hypothetical protein